MTHKSDQQHLPNQTSVCFLFSTCKNISNTQMSLYGAKWSSDPCQNPFLCSMEFAAFQPAPHCKLALRYFFLLWIKVTCNKKKKRNNLKVNSCTSDSLYSREEEEKALKSRNKGLLWWGRSGGVRGWDILVCMDNRLFTRNTKLSKG